MRRALPGWGLLALALAVPACEIRSVMIADPHDIVVAEVYLRVGEATQFAFLHRTGGGEPTVPGAAIEVRDARGTVLRYAATPDPTECLFADGGTATPDGTCHAAVLPPPEAGAFRLEPGESYALRIELADGRILTGTTTVPGSFRLRRPATLAGGRCALPPERPLEIVWTPAAGAWVYLAETHLFGLRDALAPRGIEVEDDPVRLVGLSVSAADTTIVFPTEFGIFDRIDLRDVVIALQGGVPPGVRADVLVAAADRNYVNWVRGGSFNPSGAVRVPSIRGDGTGVFGSMVTRSFEVQVADTSSLPSCLGAA